MAGNSSPETHVTNWSMRVHALNWGGRCPTIEFIMASLRLNSFFFLKKNNYRIKESSLLMKIKVKTTWTETPWIPQWRTESTIKHFKKSTRDEGEPQEWGRGNVGRTSVLTWFLSSSACCHTWGEWCRQRCRLRSLICRWISSSLGPSAPLVLSWWGLELPLCTWQCNRGDKIVNMHSASSEWE